jgi:hypothetical protein
LQEYSFNPRPLLRRSDVSQSKHKESPRVNIPAGSHIRILGKITIPVYLCPELRPLNERRVPITFDVPRDVVNSPLSLESATFPSKLVSNS